MNRAQRRQAAKATKFRQGHGKADPFDYLHERLCSIIDQLTVEVLK